MANKFIIHQNEFNYIGLMRIIFLIDSKQILWLYLVSWIISCALSQQYLDKWEFPQLSQINTVTSFNLDIESDIDDGNALLIRTHWVFSGRRCLKPTITFIFEEIDQDQPVEYIEIYADNTFTTNITRCKSTIRQCGSMKTCLDKYPFPDIDTTDNLEIGILNSDGIDPLCLDSKRTINATLTITCGVATAVEYDATKTIDLTHYNTLNPPNTTYQYYTNYIYTDIGGYYWTLYDSSFSFIGTACYEPTLSLTFEDADFGQATEWLEIYTPNFVTTNASRCRGDQDNNCGSQVRCLNGYKLYKNVFTPYWIIPVGILKTDQVSDLYCGSTLNAIVTLRCSVNRYDINHTVDVYGDNIYKLPLIQSTAAYDRNIIYDLHIKFINGTCVDPQLSSLKFQETDFEDGSSQSLQIYSATEVLLSQCIGSETIDQCEWNECIHDFDFGQLSPVKIDELYLSIIKSSNVKSLLCGYTLNIDLVISCTGNPTQSPSMAPLMQPTVNPSYSPSIRNVIEPTTAEYFDTISTISVPNKQEFNYFLILYGIALVLFGIGIAVCVMCICKKYKHHKQHPETTGDNNSNSNKYSDVNHVIKQEHYKSLKSMESVDDDDLQIEGKEMELIKVKKKNSGEMNTDLDDDDDDDSIEDMFVVRASLHSQRTAGGDETPIQTTQGLPKITPAISMLSLDETKSVNSDYCNECGLMKEGKNDSNDGLFYCFECWRDFEQLEIE